MADYEYRVRLTGEETVSGPSREARAEINLLSDALARLNERSSQGVSGLGPAISEVQRRIVALGGSVGTVASGMEGDVARSRVAWASLGSQIDRTTQALTRYAQGAPRSRVPLPGVSQAEIARVRRTIEEIYNPDSRRSGGPPSSDRVYDLQRQLDVASQISNARDEANRKLREEGKIYFENEQKQVASANALGYAQASSEVNQQKITAGKQKEYDLQRRLQVGLERQRQTITANAAGYAQANAEIEKQTSVASANKEYDLDRRLQVAFMQDPNLARTRRTGLRGAMAGGTTGIWDRLNMQGRLELQAAGVNSFQALASGMSPAHVGVMEGAQVIGAFVQGGLLTWKGAVTALTSTVGLATIGVTALAAGTALWVTSIKNANAAFAQTANAAQLQGRPARASEQEARQLADDIAKRGLLGRVESRTAANTAMSVPGINDATRRTLGLSTEALARNMFGGDVDEASKFIAEKFSSTEGIRGLVEQFRLLEGAERQAFDALGDNKFQVAEMGAKALFDQLKKTREALGGARFALGPLGRSTDIFGIVGEALYNLGGRASPLGTPAFEPNKPGPSQAQKEADDAVRGQLTVEREINKLIEERKTILAGVATARSAEAVKNIDLALSNLKTAQDARDHEVRLANLEAEKQKAEQNAQVDSRARAQVEDVQRRINQENDSFAQGALARNIAGARALTAVQVQGQQELQNEIRKTQEIQLQNRAFQSQYRAAQAPNDPRIALVEAQERLNDAVRNGLGDEQYRQGLQLQAVGLQKQVRDYTLQTAQAALQQREVIAQARDDLVGIVALRRQELSLILANPDKTDAERIGARTAVIQSQITAQKQGIQFRQEAVQQANAFEQNRLQTALAMMNLEVAGNNTTRLQVLQSEQQLTAGVMAQQQARLRGLLSTRGITLEQEASIKSELANLYEQDAQKQIQLQTQITENIKRENETRTQYFRNFFNDVEKAGADLLIAGLNKTQTRQQAFQQFGQSIVSSLVQNVTSGLSNLGGKKLAEALGVKLDPDKSTSIGDVLGYKLGDMLGITRDVPKFSQSQVQEKMAAAADAHKSAAASLLQAGEKLQAVADKGPYNGGVNPDLSPSTPGTSRIRPKNPAALPGPVDPYGYYDDRAEVAKTSGPARFDASAVSTNTTELQRLTTVLTEASKTLPEGYSVRASSTTGGVHTEGSYHYKGEAVDVSIFGPNGKIPNRGDDTTGMYEKLAVAGYRANQENYPGTNFTWGGRFGVTPGSKVPDLMHFDAGPDRGTLRPPLSQIAGGTTSLVDGIKASNDKVVQSGMKLADLQSKDTQVSLDDVATTKDEITITKELITALRKPVSSTDGLSKSGESSGVSLPSSTNTSGVEGAKSDGIKSDGTKSDGTKSEGNISSKLGLLGQGLGIAASAAAIFGRQLSPAARAVLGVVGVFGQVSSFVKNAGSVFDLFGATAKTAETATGLLSVANAANTIATTVNTTATTVNSAAQAGGSPLAAIATIATVAALGNGGVIPSAAGGMQLQPQSLSRDARNALRMVGRGTPVRDGRGGRLIVAHPGEMIVPAAETSMLLGSAMNGLMPEGSIGNVRLPADVGDIMARSMGTPTVNHGATSSNNTTLNYNGNITGYHPYASRASFESMLRTHGSTLRSWVDTMARSRAFQS